MLRFAAKRLLMIIPSLAGMIVLTFALVHLIPGDPVQMMLGERVLGDAEHAHMMRVLGLDQPLHVQLLDYIGKVVRGDLGTSIATKQPVVAELLTLLPATLELTVMPMTLAILIGIPAGIFAACHRGSAIDHTIMALSLSGYSMPVFWWGLLLILGLSVNLGWTPVSGRVGVEFFFEDGTGFMLIDAVASGQAGALKSALIHLALPAFVLGTNPMAVIARMTRSAMLETMDEDYVRTARAKGLRNVRVIGLHALRNAMIPVITVIGLQVGSLVGGAILTETIFSWPGVGRWLVDSIFRRDYPAIQGGVLMIATMIICINLAVDVIYALLNPRISHRR